MRFSTLLPLAATATALVLPDTEVMQQIAIEDRPKHGFLDDLMPKQSAQDVIKHKIAQAEDTFASLFETSKNALDDAFEWTMQQTKTASDSLTEEYFDAKAWIASAAEEFAQPPPPHHRRPDRDQPPPPPHDGPDHDHPPHKRPPHEGPPHDGPPHHGPGHDKPHHPPHHKPHKSNHTVYELIASSKYTTKLAELINEDKDLVALLNSTDKHFTVFAPTNAAFEKIPDHHKEPSKELIRKVLSYHVSSEFYPAGRILFSRTVPTLLEGTYLSTEPKKNPQRISTNVGLRGLTLNFYSRVVAADIFGKNGVIHGIDSFLIPPPSAARIITLLPSEFSTLELGLRKTELFHALNSTSNHLGGTLFAPSNWAFTKLGPKINAFLFSEYGRKYLKALLQYHVVANQTLYSDAFYPGGKSESEEEHDNDKDHKHKRPRIPRGKFHVDLPTLLKDKYLSIDVGRFGRLIDIRINGFTHVSVSDGVAKDGVIHAVSSVIIPPKQLNGELVQYQGEDLTVEDLKERLGDLVEDDASEDVVKDKHDL